MFIFAAETFHKLICSLCLCIVSVPPNMQTNRTKIQALWQIETQVKTLIHSTNRFLDFLYVL